MDDIYWINFSTNTGSVVCLCKDNIPCKKDVKRECKEYLLNFTEIQRKANNKFNVDKVAINKLKRARTELEKNLRKVKM